MMDENLQAAVNAARGKPSPVAAEPAPAAPEPVKAEPTPAEVAPTDPAPPPDADTPATDPEPPRASKQIDEWARGELKLRKERAAIAAERETLQARLKEAETAAEVIRLAKTDPRAFIERSGLDLDALTRSIIEGKAPDPMPDKISALEKQIEELRTGREQETKAQAEQRAAQALEADRAKTGAWFETKAADYPFLSAQAEGKSAVVADAIQQTQIAHYHRTKEFLDPGDAARTLEERLRATFERLRTAATTPDTAAHVSEPVETPSPATIGRRHATRTQPTATPPAKSGKQRAMERLLKSAKS